MANTRVGTVDGAIRAVGIQITFTTELIQMDGVKWNEITKSTVRMEWLE